MASELGAPLRILIIDDIPDLCRILEQEVRNKGYQVLLAMDLAESQQKCRDEDPDIIVLNSEYPEQDIQHCAALKSEFPDKYLIGLLPSLQSQPGTAIEFDHIDEHLVKPYTMQDLVISIQRQIDPDAVPADDEEDDEEDDEVDPNEIEDEVEEYKESDTASEGSDDNETSPESGDDAGAQPAKKPGSSSSRKLVGLLAALVILAGGGYYVMFMWGNDDDEQFGPNPNLVQNTQQQQTPPEQNKNGNDPNKKGGTGEQVESGDPGGMNKNGGEPEKSGDPEPLKTPAIVKQLLFEDSSKIQPLSLRVPGAVGFQILWQDGKPVVRGLKTIIDAEMATQFWTVLTSLEAQTKDGKPYPESGEPVARYKAMFQLPGEAKEAVTVDLHVDKAGLGVIHKNGELVGGLSAEQVQSLAELSRLVLTDAKPLPNGMRYDNFDEVWTDATRSKAVSFRQVALHPKSNPSGIVLNRKSFTDRWSAVFKPLVSEKNSWSLLATQEVELIKALEGFLASPLAPAMINLPEASKRDIEVLCTMNDDSEYKLHISYAYPITDDPVAIIELPGESEADSVTFPLRVEKSALASIAASLEFAPIYPFNAGNINKLLLPDSVFFRTVGWVLVDQNRQTNAAKIEEVLSRISQFQYETKTLRKSKLSAPDRRAMKKIVMRYQGSRRDSSWIVLGLVPARAAQRSVLLGTTDDKDVPSDYVPPLELEVSQDVYEFLSTLAGVSNLRDVDGLLD